MFFSPHINLSVDCQRPDLDLTTDNDNVTARLRETVTLRWNIEKENETDLLENAKLLLVEPKRVLFTLDPVTKRPTPNQNIFGDRIKCQIPDGKTYTCTLQNLTYNDTGVFELEVIIRRADDTSPIRKRKIHLLVLGMRLIIISCSCT